MPGFTANELLAARPDVGTARPVPTTAPALRGMTAR